MSLAKFLRSIGILSLALALGHSSHAVIAPGDEIPNLGAFGLEGSLPEIAGKVVLIDVWASWCAPCKASFPAFDAMQQAKGGEGLVILGVSVDRKAGAYESFIKRLNPQFATVRDGKQKLVAELSPPAMPTSYLFGRDGKLRSIHLGFHGDRTVEALENEIETLLREKI